MRNKIISAVCTSIFVLGMNNTANAQLDKEYIERNGWSLGMTVGGSDLWGDIGTKSLKDHYLNLNYGNYAMPFGGLFVRYTLHPALVIRSGINYGMISAGDDMNADLAKKADNYESDAVQRYQRNLDVRTNIWEANFMFEINLLRINPLSRAALKSFSPYLLMGIQGYHFQSKGRYINKNGAGAAGGSWINLYDLHIEGDGLEGTGVKGYKQWQLAVPLGIGGKWDLSPKMAIGIEYVYRYCFTDYLDGVSQKYLDPKFYTEANGYTPLKKEIAMAMSDKSWELDNTKSHAPGQMRGSNAGADSYSTLSITLFYKFKSKAYPWWY